MVIQKEQVVLMEYGREEWLTKERVTEEDIRYLKSLQNRKSAEKSYEEDDGCLVFNEWTFGIRALGWVGVIELKNYQITIRPRFNKDFKYFINMLQVAEGLPNIQENSMVESAKLPKLMHDFLELLAQLYLSELGKMMRIGVYKSYVTEEDNLSILRGRPDFYKNLKHNYALPPKIYCSYDELTTDVPENQYILKGLDYLTHVSRYLNETTKQQLMYYYNDFMDLCTDVDHIQNSFNYNQLNKHYKEAHRLTQILINSMTVVNLHRPTERLFTVLFNMNDVFEKFTGKFLEASLKDLYQVTLQPETFGAIQSDGGLMKKRAITPDIVISSLSENSSDSEMKLVLDTKNKDYANIGKVSNADIYQITFYAQFFSQMSVIEQGKENNEFYAIMVYPIRNSGYSGKIVEKNSNIIVPLMNGGRGRIQAKGIHVDSLIELIYSRKKVELVHAAVDLISQE
ncbi:MULTISPECIES: McrC family protein [unclassified Paenibacillus]|uniref:McrC family protein n=1 Tax=unclassified Paenibacillus TaxID=185978 RepID=UPI000CFC6E39|nr:MULTISPECIES: hypothetical protein [unclassified Paenibacillus]PQZ99034.1 hypothetical protein CQ043_28210 [Paenibacillus sp. MYb63]PRA43965.1 hypothetical protein CQ061_27425 [Paenibacillus sp. MYb67]QZN77855.1 McrC family protein [Paenibacillus sp. DR312]